MNSKKFTYIMEINPTTKYTKIATYKYSHADKIEVFISQNAAKIVYSMNTFKEPSTIISSGDRIFDDAIYKINLVHLIKYSHPVTINKIKYSISNQTNTTSNKIAIDSNSPYSSMITSPLSQTFDKDWNNIVEKIFTYKRSDNDFRISSLSSLLIGLNKSYQIEKSMYLWTSMNGFYNYLSDYAKKQQWGELQFRKETKQHQLLCKYYSWNYSIQNKSDEIDTKLFNFVVSAIKEVQINILDAYSSLINNRDNILSQLLSSILIKPEFDGYNLSPQAFFFIWLPYQIRCRYFHANVTLPLFQKKNDKIFKVLSIVNELLELFLIHNLLDLFQNDFDTNPQNKEKLHEAYNNLH